MKHSRRYFLGAISTLSILPLSMSNATNVHKGNFLASVDCAESR